MARLRARGGGVACAMVLTAAALGACGSNDDADGGSAAKGDVKPVRIAHFLASNSTHQQSYQRGAEAAAGDLEGVTVKTFVPGADTDPGKPARQVRQIEAAIASGQYDALLIEPADGTAVVPAIKQAAAREIPVVCGFGICGSDGSRFEKQMPEVVTQMGINAAKIGDDGGPIVNEACADKDPCNLVIMGGVAGFPAEKLELDRLRASLKQFPNVEIVATGLGQYVADVAYKAMKDILQAHRDVDVVFSPGDQMIVGSEQALEEAGLAGKVALIGSGASELATKAIKAKRWYASAVFRPYHSGYIGVEYAARAARGKDVPAMVDSEASSSAPAGFVTPENVDKWKPEWEG